MQNERDTAMETSFGILQDEIDQYSVNIHRIAIKKSFQLVPKMFLPFPFKNKARTRKGFLMANHNVLEKVFPSTPISKCFFFYLLGF